MVINKNISRYAWMVVGMLWFAAMLNYLDRVILTTMRDSLISSIPMTDTQYGGLTSVFLWVYGVFSPIGGFLADKFSRRKLIMVSLGVWTLVSLRMGFAQSYAELITLRGIMGIGEAFYMPSALALISDYHQQKTRSLATGIHMSGLYTGYILGGLGGFVSQYFGWRYGYYALGATGIVYSLVIALFLHDRKTEVSGQAAGDASSVTNAPERISLKTTLGSLFSNHSFLLMVAYFSLLGIAFWAITGWLPTFLKERFQLGAGTAGLSATLYIQLASFAGVLFGGSVADRWVRKNIKGRIYLPVIGFTLATPALFMTSGTDVFLFAILGLLVFGVARGFSDSNMMPILCQVIDKRYRATGYGILNFLSTICGGIMIFVGGWLKDMHVNLSVVFAVSSLCLLLAAVCMYFVKPRTQE